MRLRFPLLIHFNWSSDGLWYMTEINGRVRHHMLFQVAIIERDKHKGVEIIIGKLAIPIAWIGFR